MVKQIINGVSANTMFYLIRKYDFDEVKFLENNCNFTHFDTPYDNDDLSRCVDAAIFFGWDNVDIKIAISVAKEINLPQRIITFLEKFPELKELFIMKEYKKTQKILDEINRGKND